MIPAAAKKAVALAAVVKIVWRIPWVAWERAWPKPSGGHDKETSRLGRTERSMRVEAVW